MKAYLVFRPLFPLGITNDVLVGYPYNHYLCRMEIRLKESMYLLSDDIEHVVRAGICGLERSRLIYFYDDTAKHAIAFPKQFCVENPHLFSVKRTVQDRDVSVNDVAKLAKEAIPTEFLSAFIEKLNLL